MTPPVEDALEWLTKAAKDLQAAGLLKKAKLFDIAAFHTQQAAEKAIKGFLSFHDIEFEKTHDIEKLILKAEYTDKAYTLWRAAGKILTPYGVQIRYPGEIKDVDGKTCATALKYATGIYDLTLSLLPKEVAPQSANKPRKKGKASNLRRKKHK